MRLHELKAPTIVVVTLQVSYNNVRAEDVYGNVRVAFQCDSPEEAEQVCKILDHQDCEVLRISDWLYEFAQGAFSVYELLQIGVIESPVLTNKKPVNSKRTLNVSAEQVNSILPDSLRKKFEAEDLPIVYDILKQKVDGGQEVVVLFQEDYWTITDVRWKQEIESVALEIHTAQHQTTYYVTPSRLKTMKLVKVNDRLELKL
jgi:hypothetical protein